MLHYNPDKYEFSPNRRENFRTRKRPKALQTVQVRKCR
jgi:hypothetical protein